MPETFNEQNQLALSLLCIVVIAASCVFYAKIGTSSEYLDDPATLNSTNNYTAETSKNISKDEHENIPKPKRIKPQPACPPQDKSIELMSLCQEFIFARLSCKPEDVRNPDKHKIPKFYYNQSVKNNSNNETQNVIVNCIIAALLLTSLGAALLEFYRAKTSGSRENEVKGTKASVNKKCSLADLTVLKHHRRELVRRESVLEAHLEDEGNYQQHQGFKPAPLQRRCSFPAFLSSSDDATLGVGFPARRNSRKLSIAGDFGRRMSIVNDGGRKLSIVPDDEFWRKGSLIGEDSSPERRVHHSRLVHRH